MVALHSLFNEKCVSILTFLARFCLLIYLKWAGRTPSYLMQIQATMHAASRHRAPSLTPLPKDSEVSEV